MNDAYRRIWSVVRMVPRGRVVTYGQVAALAGLPGRARQVGYAMHALPTGTTVPWQRVVNAAGRVSRRRVFGGELTQRMLLIAEGVRFDGRGRIDLERYRWRPGRRFREGRARLPLRARSAAPTAPSAHSRSRSESSRTSAGTS